MESTFLPEKVKELHVHLHLEAPSVGQEVYLLGLMRDLKKLKVLPLPVFVRIGFEDHIK